MTGQIVLVIKLLNEIDDLNGKKQNGNYTNAVKNNECIVVMAITLDNFKTGREGAVIINFE